MIKVSPSILAGDFGKLAQEAKKAEEAGADYLHVDVMDGHFVPNLTVGPQAVAAIRKITKLPLDVHLMLTHPDRYLDAFADAGADMISVHVESEHDLAQTVNRLRAKGVKPAIVFNPDTPYALPKEVADKISMVLFMSVFPGFGGQKFIPAVLDKIRKAKDELNRRNIDIEIDGGINLQNAKDAVAAGANVLVAGTALYGSPDMKGDIQRMHALGHGS